jgi:hypothetical protein
MIARTLLAAGGVDTIILLVVMFFFVVVPAIGKWVTSVRQEANRAGPARAPGPPRPADRSIQEEIDEFLRRASQRRSDRPPASPADQPRPPLAAEIIEAEAPVGARMARQVDQDMDTSEFGRRTAQLGEEVAQTDEEFAERADEVFGHKVSGLAMRPGETAAPPQADETSEAPQTQVAAMTETTLGIATMLRDPNQILQALVMSEILRRPEWDEGSWSSKPPELRV